PDRGQQLRTCRLRPRSIRQRKPAPADDDATSYRYLDSRSVNATERGSAAPKKRRLFADRVNDRLDDRTRPVNGLGNGVRSNIGWTFGSGAVFCFVLNNLFL